jgi:hypothetical protein
MTCESEQCFQKILIRVPPCNDQTIILLQTPFDRNSVSVTGDAIAPRYRNSDLRPRSRVEPRVLESPPASCGDRDFLMPAKLRVWPLAKLEGIIWKSVKSFSAGNVPKARIWSHDAYPRQHFDGHEIADTTMNISQQVLEVSKIQRERCFTSILATRMKTRSAKFFTKKLANFQVHKSG